MDPWRLNLNTNIVDSRDAYDISKFDNYYNMSLFPSALTTSVSADTLNKVEAEINKPNLLWDKNLVKKLGYYNFNTAFNNTGFNQFFGYNKDKSDIFGPSTYNRYVFYNSLKLNYNSPEKTINGVYWNGTTWIKKPLTLLDKVMYDFSKNPLDNYLTLNEVSLDFKPKLVTGLNDDEFKYGGNKSLLNEEDNPTGESSNISEVDDILNKVFKKPEETLFSKILKNLPLATNTANLMSSLISNKKNEKILKEGLFPVLQNTYERFSPVTGAFGLTLLANRLAANLRSRFSKARTSDANSYQALQLEANRIADLYTNQANLQDWQEIKKTRAEALARLEDNLARRTQIANTNIKSIAKYNLEIAKIRAAKNKLDSTNISNYITGLGDTFNKLYQEKKKDLETKLNLLYNTLISSEEEMAKTYLLMALSEYEQWSKVNPGKTIKDWPYYEQYKQFLRDITRNLARNKLYYATKWNGIEDNLLNYTKLQPFTDYLKSGGRLVPTYGYGGDVSQYFTPFLYQSYSTQQSTYEDKKKSLSVEQPKEKDNDFLDDYIKLLLGYVKELKGLTSDSAYVSKYMMSILNKWKNNGEFLTPYDMAGDIMSLQLMIYRCTDEKTNFDKAYLNLYTKEALNDIAITGMGTIVVRNIKTKKLDNLSLENYIKYLNQYIPVSNAELARIRSNDPSLAFQTKINDILNSSVSAKTFDDYIENSIKGLGTNYTMTSGPSKDILDGIELLSNLTEELLQQLVQELSNGYVNTKLASKTQTPQIKMALEYLVNSMPKNYKVWAAFKLGTSKEDEAVKALAALKLSSGASSTSVLDNMIKNGKNGKKSTSERTSTGSSGDDLKIGYWTLAQKELIGSLLTPIKIEYELAKLDLYGTKLPNPEGVTGNMSLNQFLDKSKGSQSLDTSRASANGIRLDPSALDMVMIQSNYLISVLTLPSKPDGTPNMELLPKYERLNKDLEKYKKELLANEHDPNSNNYKNLVSLKITDLTKNDPELAFALRGENLAGSSNLKLYIVLRGVLPGNISTINLNGETIELDDVKNKDWAVFKASKADKDSYEFALKKDNKGNDIPYMEDYDGEYITNIFIPFNDQNANTTIIADDKDLKLGAADENADLQLHFNYNPTQVNR